MSGTIPLYSCSLAGSAGIEPECLNHIIIPDPLLLLIQDILQSDRVEIFVDHPGKALPDGKRGTSRTALALDRILVDAADRG